MLHQFLKYVDTQGVVKIVYAEKKPYRGIENYFTDVIHYKDEQEGETDDGNEADVEPNDNIEKASIELNHLVVELSDVTINSYADNEGEWVLKRILLLNMSCLVLLVHLIMKIF